MDTKGTRIRVVPVRNCTMDGPRCVRVSYRTQTRTDSAAVIGPIVGGYVSQTKLGWRFPFWIMFIVAAVALLGFVFVLPETVSTMTGVLQRVSHIHYRLHAVCTCTAEMASAEAASGKRRQGRLCLPLRHHPPARPWQVLAHEPRTTLPYVTHTASVHHNR